MEINFATLLRIPFTLIDMDDALQNSWSATSVPALSLQIKFASRRAYPAF